MKYKRSLLCSLAAIDVDRFKSLVRRDQLPTVSSDESGYSDLDVLAIAAAERLACQIGISNGLAPGSAAAVVENAIGMIDDPFATTRSDQWIGYIGQPWPRGSHDGGFSVAGSLSTVLAKLTQQHAEVPVERIFLLNLSEVLRAIRERAESLGTSFPAADEE